MKRPLAVVIMAAGKGTRMKNPDTAKVMYTIGGKPLVEHVVDLALHLGAARTIVIVGWQKDAVISHLAKVAPSAVCVEQSPQLGTGHAVMQAEKALNGFEGDVLVLSGDVPLLSRKTTNALIDLHAVDGAAVTVLTARLHDPTGYGRILREENGAVIGVVEHKDATEEQRKVREINSGIYVFDKEHLFEGLRHITPENVQKEYYLTDVLGYFWRNKLPVRAVVADEPVEIQGVNTLEQLEAARQVLEKQ